MSEVINENVTEEVTNEQELKTVVVYDAQDIESVLVILDQQINISGIENMRNIVNTFDVLKEKGSVQQAMVNQERNGYVDPSLTTPANTPSYVGEGEVMYDGEEEVLDAPFVDAPVEE